MTDSGISLWLVQPAECNLQKYGQLLGDAEQARAARFRFRQDHDSFVAVHGLRRLALAKTLSAPAKSLRFGRSAQGRPMLDEPTSELKFSASRRRGLVAVAVANCKSLGVDVENVAPIADPETLLGKFLDRASIATLSGLETSELQSCFAQLWTITEACAKARGTGLETFSPRMQVSFDSAHSAVVDDGQAQWHCHLLAPDPMFRVAVAFERGARRKLILRNPAELW